jgi:hypothetical protein
MPIKLGRKELWNILHPHPYDPSYEYLYYLEQTIKHDILLVEHQSFPHLPTLDNAEYEMLRRVSVQHGHDPSRVHFMARVLFQSFRERMLQDTRLKII